MKVTEIFTPSDYPTHTYVSRDEDRIEERLREAIGTPGEIVSVSGPSKSGKTVLIEKVAGRENLITVTGGGIRTANDVWEQALDWMGAPTQSISTGTTTVSGNVSTGLKGKAGLPFVGSVAAEGSLGASLGRASAKAETRGRTGMNQVIAEIGKSDYVLLIDDFHYMPVDIQADVAKQIKEAARQGVKICTASVPHRSDDVVRSNPELRGRVRAVDTRPWSIHDLVRIAELGFPLMGATLSSHTVETLAIEASSSPQLMQAICLQVCFTAGLRETSDSVVLTELSQEQLRHALEETSTRADFASLLRMMHTGPKIRGTERKEFELSDGTRGDVYRALLVALKSDPPTLSFPWNDLSRRLQKTCRPESPQAASLSTACTQVARMAKDMFPTQRVVDWEGDPANLLSIEDPYFLFYLRWSQKLATLAGASQKDA
jgi:hypothetical protein